MTALLILAAWIATSFIAGAAIAIIGSRRKDARRQRADRVRGVLGRGENLNHFGGNKA